MFPASVSTHINDAFSFYKMLLKKMDQRGESTVEAVEGLKLKWMVRNRFGARLRS